MPQTTEVQRVNRIAELLREALKQPPEKQPEGERLPAIGGGDALVCPVITIGVDEVVLNPNSHRIKAQLQDEPEWATLKNDPYSEPSQLLIRRLVREARKPDAFKDLQKSLLDEGPPDEIEASHRRPGHRLCRVLHTLIDPAPCGNGPGCLFRGTVARQRRLRGNCDRRAGNGCVLARGAMANQSAVRMRLRDKL